MDLETKNFPRIHRQQNICFVCFITNKFNTKTLRIIQGNMFHFQLQRKMLHLEKYAYGGQERDPFCIFSTLLATNFDST